MGHSRQDKNTGEGIDSSAATMGIAPSRGKAETGGPVIVVAGPTASGKSAAAMAIAEAFDGVVINADSMQVYRELPILTAQPTAEDMSRVPHRLYGTLSAHERCTAGRWREMALAEIRRARSCGRLPVVTGGTGLYLRALMEGLAPVPPIPPQVRAEAAAKHQALGAQRFHAELAALDPVMAARLAPGDSQRLRRAYEVVAATGRSLASFLDETVSTSDRFVSLLLMPPRAVLYARCDRRARAMVAAGALDEVRALLGRGLDPGLPAMKAVGVRELARHLSGEVDLDGATGLLQRATRQYAKRQYTWFRHQLRSAQCWYAQFSESIEPEIFSFIRKNIDRSPRAV